MTPRGRTALAGAAAATVWGLLEPLDRRLFRCDHSDVELLGRGNRPVGFLVHASNGALFGLAFDVVRQRVAVDQRRLALTLALVEHVTLWPMLGLVNRDLVRSPRAFAQGTFRHVVFGLVLGRLAPGGGNGDAARGCDRHADCGGGTRRSRSSRCRRPR